MKYLEAIAALISKWPSKNKSNVTSASNVEGEYFSLLRRVRNIYAAEGIEITQGVNSYLCSNVRSAQFVQYHKDGSLLTPHSGIGYDELLLIGQICRNVSAKNVFIIGNGLGWSTIGLSLMLGQANIIAIEPEAGIDLTNSIATRHNLNCKVVKGYSPQDNARIVASEFTKVPDLVLIDGMHDKESVIKDFSSVFSLCGPNTTYIFHDVLTFDLSGALKEAYDQTGSPNMKIWLATATSSGLGIIGPAARNDELDTLISLFSMSESAVGTMRRIGRERAHPPVDYLRYINTN